MALARVVDGGLVAGFPDEEHAVPTTAKTATIPPANRTARIRLSSHYLPASGGRDAVRRVSDPTMIALRRRFRGSFAVR
jgi:hypothetical protein